MLQDCQNNKQLGVCGILEILLLKYHGPRHHPNSMTNDLIFHFL